MTPLAFRRFINSFLVFFICNLPFFSFANQSGNDNFFLLTQPGDELEKTSKISRGIKRVDNDYLIIYRGTTEGEKVVFKFYDAPLALGFLNENSGAYYMLSVNGTSYVYRIFTNDDQIVLEAYSRASPPSVIWCTNEEWPIIYIPYEKQLSLYGYLKFSKIQNQYKKSKSSCLIKCQKR